MKSKSKIAGNRVGAYRVKFCHYAIKNIQLATEEQWLINKMIFYIQNISFNLAFQI